nr:MAG TPA: hypothetical protein [Caudoviricetes sp.]
MNDVDNNFSKWYYSINIFLEERQMRQQIYLI